MNQGRCTLIIKSNAEPLIFRQYSSLMLVFCSHTECRDIVQTRLLIAFLRFQCRVASACSLAESSCAERVMHAKPFVYWLLWPNSDHATLRTAESHLRHRLLFNISFTECNSNILSGQNYNFDLRIPSTALRPSFSLSSQKSTPPSTDKQLLISPAWRIEWTRSTLQCRPLPPSLKAPNLPAQVAPLTTGMLSNGT